MSAIRTVLCPVDFTAESERELDLAVALCRRFDARLVLEHNLEPRPPSYLTISWMWSEEFERGEQSRPADAEARLQELLRDVSRSVRCEARLTRGPIDQSLLILATQLPADLVVMSSHGRSTPEHRSLTERLVEKSPCPVLVPGHGGKAAAALTGESPEEARVLVPLELSSKDRATLEYTAKLAADLPMRVELVHVSHESDPKRQSKAAEAARERIRRLVPEKLEASSRTHVAFGEPAGALLEKATELEVDLILMAAHRKSLWHRNAQATDADLVHESRCPVWFVPPSTAKRLAARVAGLVLTGALLAAGGLVAAEEEASENAERGRLLYRIHCASCHGAAGQGDGPVSPYLKLAPTDLTALTEDGSYPAERVYRIIDGRSETSGHGRRDMPVWGLSLRVEGLDADQERDVRARIESLVEYLGTIQESDEP